jgi:protocatechuate 3,4-dioxygenase beta subunit
LCTAIFIAVGLGPFVRADDGKPSSKPASTSPSEAKTFDLRIVDPDGKPVPDAKVNLSTNPPLGKQIQVRAGSIWNRPRFGINLRSDENGRVVVELPAHLEYLNFRIHKPGYGFYWAWSNKPGTELKPRTVKLERAWTIGGVVVDGDGKPVPNARILLTIRWAGLGQMGPADRLWTNSKGTWKFESVPESMSAVTAEISEPKYRTANPTLSRAEFEIKVGHEATAKTTLQVGVVVTGKITDETGKPIAKALVRTRVGNDARSAFTGKDGTYRLEGCGTTQEAGGVLIAGGNGVIRKEGRKPGQVTIVASAKGRAAQVQHAEIGPGLGPVNFELKPGGTIRVRVLDEKGRPAPNATIFVQAWRADFDYFQFDRAPREADVDGVWEWHEAPMGELTANIGRPNGLTLNRPLSARKEEYVFRVPPALVISGKVVDAETKQPIKTFRVVRGTRWMEQQQVYWDTNNKLIGAEGAYQMRETWEQSAYLVRIEADGYLHGVSRDIKCDEGKVEVDFELLKGKDVVATVLTPEGIPAGGAKVAVVGGNVGLVINHGEIDIKGGRQDIQETDATGRFRIATKNDEFWLVVTHQSGYAELTGLSNSNPRVVKLAPWARIEGTFQLAHKPQADVEISLDAQLFGRNAPPTDRDSQTTDLHGRFAFDRVIPGKRRISAKRTSGEGESETTCSRSTVVDCPAGKTARVAFETGGRPVIGQLQAPSDSKPSLQLSAAQIYVGQEQDGRRADSQLQFHATPDRKGNFSIDDVPPGNYFLSAFISGRPDSYFRSHRFTVPKVNEKLSQRPVDVGVLTLEPARRFQGAQKK